jgi:1-acyl-sn-glycerol-3-phosphate acyltransferase
MKNFFAKPKQGLFGLKDLPRDVLLYRVMPYLLLEIVRKYLRVTIEGIENIPTTGRGLIIPNHSGFSGFDAVVLGHEIFKATGRIPRVLTHHLWFMNQVTSLPAQKMGFVEATTKNGLGLLKKNNLVMLFPEGENGNFKPTSQRYRLQEFKRGFIRMALQSKSPIIPTLIIGAEETHINLRKLKFSKFLAGSVLPLPLNVIPLPARWNIRFLEPIDFPFKPEAANDSELVRELASDVRERMQRAINKELKKRGGVYF